MKNPPGITFMKDHDGISKKSKSHATYIPTPQKLKDIRTGLVHGNTKKQRS